MTQEDKLKEARKLYETANKDQKYVLEKLFPQLQESEYEKIRKWIIDDIRFNMNNEPLNNSKYKKEAEKAIAWLEKQGEEKSVEWSEDDEEHVNSLLKRLEGLCRNEFQRTRFAISEDIIWLESLKERKVK